ncbi:hypothetical protein LNI95_11590 [Tenacibaculum dicentrarchi]|uniref:hypothetical protein n=1 Tax=Tenacibaculum finnmarkense TaxID=2781243 RepID=UPI001BE627DD|nr:hypothetical protein [Tenacibaculum finnmarkense]MCD8438306.1 hypothetical protein [Tenacibaculum dicentrarchi]MCD8403908.1 hypothetical protein [Tenacibaculum finnmarkense genomovar finnmarkense]MCD8455237.1 hypothetical protein [Tenacibaculum finnmarkense genomovar ulcerans]WBX67932.1 hypothetical protein PG910_07285 [Tenacibaculum dicentrarchi]WCC43991.1 hypothetical protein PJW08_09250 [Tenacibaculum finnmarkense]
MNSLNDISIKGRFAIGLYCIENYSKKNGLYHNETLKIILEKLSEFTSLKNRLDIWDNEIVAYLPKYHKTEFNKDINEEFYNQLVDFYSNTDYEDFFELLELCLHIATNHLFGGIKTNSPETSEIVKQIITITEIYNFDYNKLAEKYSINKNDGWGKEFNYRNFRPK